MSAPKDHDWAFTCLLPVHAQDDPEHFQQALDSVEISTVRPEEIIVCQDGVLPGRLRATVQRAVSKGARLSSNSGSAGLHHNLNHALPEVRTPWIARIDADDINLPHRFEAQIARLRAEPRIDALGGGILEFWPDGRCRYKPLPCAPAAILSFARWRNPINHMTAFIRTQSLIDCGGYPDVHLKQDYALWLKMLAGGCLLGNLDEPLVLARLGETFHARRSGPRNVSSEIDLFQIKRSIPGWRMGAPALALAIRATILSLRAPTRWVYEGLLRQ